MTRSLFLIILIVCIAACKKSKSPSQPQDPADSSQVNPKPVDSIYRLTIMYYGEAHDYSDCDTRRDGYMPDSLRVTVLKYPPSYHNTTIVFTGSGILGTQSFKQNTTNEYMLGQSGNKTYNYSMKDDSLYASFSDIQGQCVEIYSFKGKKK